MNLDPQLSWQIRRFFRHLKEGYLGTGWPQRLLPSQSTQKYVKMIINETIYSYSKRSKMNKHMKHSTTIQARTMLGDSRQFWYLTSVIQWCIRHKLDTEFWYTHLHTCSWLCLGELAVLLGNLQVWTIKLRPVQTTATPSICCNTECTTLHIVVRQHPRENATWFTESLFLSWFVSAPQIKTPTSCIQKFKMSWKCIPCHEIWVDCAFRNEIWHLLHRTCSAMETHTVSIMP